MYIYKSQGRRPSDRPALCEQAALIHSLATLSLLAVVALPMCRYGLGGQQFEFTGEEGRIYSLITDFDDNNQPSLLVNTLFGGAFTSGIFTDPDTLEVKSYTPKGTWIIGAAVQVEACNKSLG